MTHPIAQFACLFFLKLRFLMHWISATALTQELFATGGCWRTRTGSVRHTCAPQRERMYNIQPENQNNPRRAASLNLFLRPDSDPLFVVFSSSYRPTVHTWPYLLLLTYTTRNSTVPGHVRWRTAKHALRKTRVRENKIRMFADHFQKSFVWIELDKDDVLR